MKLKEVKKMSFGERGREVERLRRAIVRFVKLANNAKCHVEEDRLARAVGLKQVPRNIITREKMLKNCTRYVNRECHAGRITSDLTKIKI